MPIMPDPLNNPVNHTAGQSEVSTDDIKYVYTRDPHKVEDTICNKCKILLSGMRKAVELGCSLEDLEVIIQAGCDIGSLSTLMASDQAAGPGPDLSGRHSIPPFSKEALHKFLVSFIVVDDQSLNVVECPEFQRLLLLHEDLTDKDIPRHTKLREDMEAHFTVPGFPCDVTYL
ncbi:hypothetical protein HYDPIDRAFT_32224 [Hydnomerulius pinastri MD-312]|uniref:Uncharacterized protein n=1 Tax=Hydnomerulius pinastri MD-312 TaxID=994086 RepID=A0A0C9W2X7_9AGAM|nr:hypothetical protein HYDPIDRAFT_32224 [Hydnomerulius pinastri MD-312]